MRTTRLTVWLLLAAVLGIGSAPVLAEDTDEQKSQAKSDDPVLAGPKAHRRGGWHHDRGRQGFDGKHDRSARTMQMLRELDLTDQQKDQIHTIKEQVKADMEAWREEHKEQFEAIKAELEAARKAAHEKFKQLRATAPAQPDTIHEKIMDVLTPEQKEKLEQRRAEMQRRDEEMRESRDRDGDEHREHGDTHHRYGDKHRKHGDEHGKRGDRPHTQEDDQGHTEDHPDHDQDDTGEQPARDDQLDI